MWPRLPVKAALKFTEGDSSGTVFVVSIMC